MSSSPVSFSSSEYDAAEVFADALMNQLSREDVRNMVDTQRNMLSRFEKTNEMLINFNILSANRCAATSQEFKKHTQLLFEMKKDLDSVFKRIRTVKERLGKVYPESFKACGSSAPLLEEEEGEEEAAASLQNNKSSEENQPTRVAQPQAGDQSTGDAQTVATKDKTQTVPTKDKTQTLPTKDKTQTVSAKDRPQTAPSKVRPRPVSARVRAQTMPVTDRAQTAPASDMGKLTKTRTKSQSSDTDKSSKPNTGATALGDKNPRKTKVKSDKVKK